MTDSNPLHITSQYESENEDFQQRKRPENLKKRAFLNSVTSILDYTGVQFTGFFVNPYIVSGLGSAVYGIWQMLGQMTGYTKIADTRATQVLKWSIANKRDVASDKELQTELSTALYITIAILPLVLIAGGIIAWYAPVITRAEPEYFNIIRITCSLLVASLAIAKIFDLFEAVLRGMNLGFKRMGVRAVIIIISGVLKVIAITNGYGLIGLAVIHIFTSFITGMSFYYVVKKHVPWFSFGKTNKEKLLSYGKLSGWFMASSIIKMLYSSSDKILLGYLAGPVFVTKYVLTMFTTSAAQGLMTALIDGVIPGFGKLFGNKQFDKIKKARSLMFNLLWLLTGSFAFCLMLFNKSFLILWVGETHFAGMLENILIIAIGIQQVFYDIDNTLINATLRLQNKVFLMAGASLITIVLAFVLVKSFLIVGLCISILAGRFLLSVGYPLIIKKQINDQSSLLNKKQVRPILFFISLMTGAILLHKHIIIESWWLLIGAGGFTMIASVFLFYFVGLDKNNKLEVRHLISTFKT
jgi:O-antigen/teichoic acid export membrane protein